MKLVQVVTFLAAVLASAAMLVAQESQETAPPSTFTDTLDVQLINVEVWVTDRKGEPVTGLTAGNFQLSEDGKPVDIAFFAEVDERPERLMNPSEEQAAPSPSPAVPATVEPSHMVLYFDQLNLQPTGRQALIDSLRDMLSSGQIEPERVLILRQDSDLFTEAPFGSSLAELEASLDRVAKSTIRGAQSAQEKRLAIDRLQQVWQESRENAGRAPAQSNSSPDNQACELFSRRAMPDIEIYSRETLNRIRTSVTHLTSAVSFLAALPGAKTLVYLSDALETNPGADLLGFIQGVCPGTGVTSTFQAPEGLRDPFHRLTRHANANRVTIWSMQPSGLRTTNLSSAQTGGFDFRALNRLAPLTRENERDGLALIAAETGGRAIFNQGDLGNALDSMATDLQRYYSLAYVPTHDGDMADHSIKVKLVDAKGRLRHRRGYRDKSPDQRMNENLLGALHLGLVSNPLAVGLGQGQLKFGKGRKAELPLYVFVPASNVVFVPRPEGQLATLSVKVMARQTDNPGVAFVEKDYLVEAPPDPENVRLNLPVSIELPPGLHLVAVALRDEMTQETSYVSTTLQIGGTDLERP